MSQTARFQAAQALWQRGDVAAADTLLREILAAEPAHAPAAGLLATLLQSQGRLGAASATMAALFRSSQATPELALRCAQFARQSRRQRLAAQICAEALAAGCASADLHALAGNIARELGEFDAARAHFLAALDRGVNLDAWFVLGALASLQRYDAAAHPDFARLDAHLRDPGAAPAARAASGFGLAKAYDDVGDHAAAAATLRVANALAGQAQHWSRAAWQRRVDECVAVPCADVRHGRREAAGDDAFIPVFIAGLPRSGTTLAARQLARHPDVVDRGELPHIPYIAARLEARGLARDPEALGEAAELYRRHVRQDDAPARFYLDGNQMNFRHLDLIARLFPEARVIHCVRGRRDTALSIYSQYFAHADCAFANDFGDIAAFALGHDRLLEHWRRQSGLAIRRVAYEDLVADTAAVSAQLCTFAGIAVADAAPRDAAITSSSLWQARQPVYRSSIGRWRSYAPFLPELEKLFAPDAP